MHRHRHRTSKPTSKALRLETLDVVARGHAYRLRWSAGDERALMDAVRALADDAREPLDWFDAALVAYELARRVDGTRVITALTTTPPSPDPRSKLPRNPYQSES